MHGQELLLGREGVVERDGGFVSADPEDKILVLSPGLTAGNAWHWSGWCTCHGPGISRCLMAEDYYETSGN